MMIKELANRVVVAKRKLADVDAEIASQFSDWELSGGDLVELKRTIKGLRITRAKTRHGEGSKSTMTPEYRVWRGMLGRCSNPTNAAWPDYGGRGIAVCPNWSTYENFLADMGRRPTPLHSLDRINNDLGYSRENCRWASKSVQARNRRSSTSIEWKGVVRTIVEWGEITGLSVSAISFRIKAGWPIDVALTAPQRITKRSAPRAEIEGRQAQEAA